MIFDVSKGAAVVSAFHRDLHVDYAPEIYPRASVTGANIGPHHKCLRHQLVIGYHCVSYLASSASNPSLGCAVGRFTRQAVCSAATYRTKPREV